MLIDAQLNSQQTLLKYFLYIDTFLVLKNGININIKKKKNWFWASLWHNFWKLPPANQNDEYLMLLACVWVCFILDIYSA
jgi:hypothetical protein